MSKAIGIDLGTTNSCVSVVEGGNVIIIPNEKGGLTTPSVVAFAKNGDRLVGEAAKRQAAVNSERTVSAIKRRMGTDWKIKIDGKNFIAQEISAMILRKLKEDAERYLGSVVTDAVITVPAYFNDIQRQATKDAGRIAGLNVMRIINEPTSAALAYGLNHGEPQKIMVYDLGGGTFDVSIIEIGESVIEVLATNGDNHLGGDDFDEKIADHIVKAIEKDYQVDLKKDFTALQRIREVAEQAKKELSASTVTNIILPYLTQRHGQPVSPEYKLSRNRFNEITKELVDRTERPVRNALMDAGIAASELSKVLLVGGSTRIPAVQAKVQELTGFPPSQNINSDECVAQGAAIQADTLSAKSLVVAGVSNSLLLLDVTPLSLAIETVGNVATRVVERNSTLPVHYSQIFTTAAPYQPSVEIHVLQGERPMARDNKTIGKFRLNGIQLAPAGVPQIEVTFDIDTNGILKVSARDLATGKEQSITITEDGKMSESEIQQAISDARAYAEQDRKRRNAVDINNEANALIFRIEQAVKKLGKDIDKEEKKRIKNECGELQKLISKNKPENSTPRQVETIREAMERLESISSGVVSRAGGR
jgi:molecular chaperone DnaK